MAIAQLDATKAGSTGYYLSRLGRILDARANVQAPLTNRTMQVLADYYNGKQQLAFATAKFREAFGGLFNEYAENVCEVVVNSQVERIAVQGLRLDPKVTDGDDVAWRIWQVNNLDARMAQGFREAAIKGEVNILVGPAAIDPSVATISLEDPLESVVVVDRGQRVVALKRWFDTNYDRWRAFVYWPDRIEKFWSKQQGINYSMDEQSWVRLAAWEWQEVAGEDAVLQHGLGRVPMVPLANMPNLAGVGRSELSSVLPIQDAINKLVADMLLSSEFGAFRQRWAIGVDIPVDPDTGEPVTSFTAAVNRMWLLNAPEDQPDRPVSVGEFSPTPLDPYINAVKQRLQMIATITRMPPHYLLGDAGQWPSGESLAAAETGLVAKCNDRARDYADPIEEAFRIAFHVVGDPDRAAILDSEILWRDPRFRSESQHVDALVKLKALNLPDEYLWEKVPLSPQELQRVRAIIIAQRLEATSDRIAVLSELVRLGFTPDAAAKAAGMPTMEHSGLPPATLQTPPSAALPSGPPTPTPSAVKGPFGGKPANGG